MGRIRRRWGEGREQATAMRLEGKSYREIHAALGISKSTLSGWLRDVPLTEEQRAFLDARKENGVRSRAVAIRAGRVRRTEVLQEEAAAEIGPITDRELFLVGVALYWAEGSKNKPWAPSTSVKFINSDPGVIRVFLDWLALIGVPPGAIRLNVTIHETADVARATAFWSDVAGIDSDSFGTPWLKRHNPTTNRKNTDDAYVGCLVISVRRSTDLNRRIAGWWSGIVGGSGRRHR